MQRHRLGRLAAQDRRPIGARICRPFTLPTSKTTPRRSFCFRTRPRRPSCAVRGISNTFARPVLHLAPMNSADRCPECGHETLVRIFRPVVHVRVVRNRQRADRSCPYCGARNGISILGSRAASLTSVLINQLYASVYNDDKKLLTFSDNVQDAAHRAGFFAGRTFRFNFRTAPAAIRRRRRTRVVAQGAARCIQPVLGAGDWTSRPSSPPSSLPT